MRVPRRALRLSAEAMTQVTMTIDLGAGAPGDVESVKRIDGTALPGSTASVAPGDHTVGWDVVSPTVRPPATG